MPKSLLIFTWTLAVALAAFAAGRWAASANEPIAPSGANMRVSAQSTERDPALSPASSSSNKVLATRLDSTISKQMPSELRNRSYATDHQQMQLLIVLAATNPQLAMEKSQNFRGSIKAKAQTAILEVWGAIDPNAAWSWVVAFQPDNNVQFLRLLEVIGRSEPHTAVTFAEQFVVVHRELRKDIYGSLLSGITQAGAYSLATDLVDALEIEAETKAELSLFVVGAWAAYEPQAAMQWVMRQPEELKAAAITPLSESWSDADPQGAVHFAVGLTDASARETLLLPSFKKWLDTEPAAASSWLAAVQPDRHFDSLFSELATQPGLSNGQVKEALGWAGKVQDAELRLGSVTSILSALKQKDSNAAAVYLQDLAYLTESERTQLMVDLAFNR